MGKRRILPAKWLATVLLAMLAACAGKPMSDAEFDAFLERANAELRQKQKVLDEKYRLGDGRGRWFFDQATELLQFFDEKDRLSVEADVIDVGSYAPTSSSWKWAWSNDSVLAPLRRKAEKLKELTRVTGLQIFSRPQAFPIEGEAMAWEFCALAVQHLGAQGCYRAPSSTGGPTVFLAITTIRRR